MYAIAVCHRLQALVACSGVVGGGEKGENIKEGYPEMVEGARQEIGRIGR